MAKSSDTWCLQPKREFALFSKTNNSPHIHTKIDFIDRKIMLLCEQKVEKTAIMNSINYYYYLTKMAIIDSSTYVPLIYNWEFVES